MGMTVTVTGAAGRMASLLRPQLRDLGWQVRLVDLRMPQDAVGEHESMFLGSVTDPVVMAEAVAGADLVVHLGGIHRETDWDTVMTTNVTGTRVVLDAARDAGVRKVLLASSTHAVGFWDFASARGAAGALPPRPDTYYGLSKVAMEGLGSLYADRFGMKIISARIGTSTERPDSARTLATWLSPGDLRRLVEATATDHGLPGHHVVWAVSANTRGWADLAAGRAAIGYEPIDDAEQWAATITATDDPTGHLLGGPWTTAEHRLGVDNYPGLPLATVPPPASHPDGLPGSGGADAGAVPVERLAQGDHQQGQPR